MPLWFWVLVSFQLWVALLVIYNPSRWKEHQDWEGFQTMIRTIPLLRHQGGHGILMAFLAVLCLPLAVKFEISVWFWRRVGLLPAPQPKAKRPL